MERHVVSLSPGGGVVVAKKPARSPPESHENVLVFWTWSFGRHLDATPHCGLFHHSPHMA